MRALRRPEVRHRCGQDSPVVRYSGSQRRLQFACNLRLRSGAAQQQAATAAVTGFWKGVGSRTDQGRLRVLPQPADRRQLAVADAATCSTPTTPTTRPAHRFDAAGRFIPMFVPGDSSIDFYPATSARRSTSTTTRCTSRTTGRSTAAGRPTSAPATNTSSALSTGDIISVRNNRIVPRLAPPTTSQGNGNHVIHVTYGQYRAATTRRWSAATARSATRPTSSASTRVRQARASASRRA